MTFEGRREQRTVDGDLIVAGSCEEILEDLRFPILPIAQQTLRGQWTFRCARMDIR